MGKNGTDDEDIDVGCNKKFDGNPVLFHVIMVLKIEKLPAFALLPNTSQK